jgi:hypothetical protein
MRLPKVLVLVRDEEMHSRRGVPSLFCLLIPAESAEFMTFY